MQTRRRVIGGFVVLLLACAGSAWAQHAWDAASQAAVLTADWGKVAEAARHWQQQEASAPVAAWLLGYAGLATGDYRLALEGFGDLREPLTSQQLLAWAEGLVAEHPTNAGALMLKGDALARSGRYPEALATLDEAERLTPPTALLYDLRGVVRALARQAEAAEADFRRALTLDGNFADAYCNLGLLHLRQGAWAAAIAALTRALELAPAHPAARNARGVAYLQAGDPERALADLTQAVEESPGFATATANLQVAQGQQARLAWRGTGTRGEGMPGHSITIVLADPKEMNTALAFASEMVQAGMGQGPVVAKTPQEALAKARSQPVLLESPVVVGNSDTVLGYKVQRDLQALGSQGRVNVVTLNGAAAEAGMRGVQRHVDTMPRGNQGPDLSVQLITPSHRSPGTLKPDEVSSLRAIAQRGGELSARGIRVAAYETLGEPWNFRNVKPFQQESRIDLYVTPFQGGEGALSMGLPSKDRPLPLSFSLGGSKDSASSRADLERDWIVRRGGNEQHIRAKLGDFGKDYIGKPQLPQPGPHLPPQELAQLAKPGFSPPGRAAAVPEPNYRLPVGALSGSPGDKRGGVAMKADVVKDQPADTSGLFGGTARAQPAVAQQAGLVAPFLLFCAWPTGS